MFEDPEVERRLVTVAFTKKLFQNVSTHPGDPRYRSINIEDATPILAAYSLAPVELLRAAGFIVGESHFVLNKTAPLGPIDEVLAHISIWEAKITLHQALRSMYGTC
jgi:hypothetical protein